MLQAEKVRGYAELPQPVLTVYVNTNPAKVTNLRPEPEFLSWLNAAGKHLAETVSYWQQRVFRQQLERVANFLRDRGPRERGMVIFCGPEVWEVAPLNQEVDNELHWGAPSVAQLFWLLDQHKPYCIVTVDRTSARYFRYHLGEFSQLGERSFEIDISDWTKQDMGKFAAPREGGLRGAVGVKRSRGSQRDTFEHRVDAQYAHLCTQAAGEAAQLTKAQNLSAVFLVGSDRLIAPIAAAFPPEFSRPVVKVEKDLGRLEATVLEQRLAPVIAHWERAHQADLVATLLADSRGTILGMDETLAQLQQGGIRKLVIARDLDTRLRRCTRCGWTDRSAGAVCSACGGEREYVSLREALPGLAWKFNVEVHIVSGDAAARLKGAEGMGGWLRVAKEARLASAVKQAG
jgi:hypothetical protein